MSSYLNKATSSHLGTVADLIVRIFYALPNPLKEQNIVIYLRVMSDKKE